MRAVRGQCMLSVKWVAWERREVRSATNPDKKVSGRCLALKDILQSEENDKTWCKKCVRQVWKQRVDPFFLDKRILLKASTRSFWKGRWRPGCRGRALNARMICFALWVRCWSQEGTGWDQCFRKCWCQGWVEKPEIFAIYKASPRMSHLIFSWQMVS